ncbi:MAG TPA: hypothetical protein VG963_03330 [Polyangiaceae bacterium]|nr:hypothetical protein [Polyangiaceae bacterium]
MGLCVGLFGWACSSSDKFPNGQYDQSAGSAGSSGAGGGSAGASAVSGNAGTGPAGSAGAGTTTNDNAGLTQVYDFKASLEGFRINYYCSDANTCVSVSAAPAADADAGADAGDAGLDAAAPPATNDFVSASFDPAVGDPDPGSAKLELQFSGPSQVAEFALNPSSVNLTGKTITARVTMDAGSPGGSTAKLYVKTGANYLYADSGQVTLVAGTWSTLTYSTPSYIATPTTDYDISDVREIGIEVAPPASPALMVLAPAVIHIDTLEY